MKHNIKILTKKGKNTKRVLKTSLNFFFLSKVHIFFPSSFLNEVLKVKASKHVFFSKRMPFYMVFAIDRRWLFRVNSYFMATRIQYCKTHFYYALNWTHKHKQFICCIGGYAKLNRKELSIFLVLTAHLQFSHVHTRAHAHTHKRYA